MVLATNGRRFGSYMAAVLRPWPLVLVGCGLVLVFRLFLGLGGISLWPLVPSSPQRLAVDAGNDLGAFVGELALFGWLLRLGAFTAGSVLCEWRRL